MMNYCNPWQYITYTQEISACQYEYKMNSFYQLFVLVFYFRSLHFNAKCLRNCHNTNNSIIKDF